MSESINISVRLDQSLKRQAETLFEDLGMNMTTAITIFLRQAVRAQGIPFFISRLTNAETVVAMQEAERIAPDPDGKGYDNLDTLRKDLKA